MPPLPAPAPGTSTPLAPLLVVTFLVSVSTGVFWNAMSFIAKHTYDFTQPRNLVLYAVVGAIYTAGAFNAGRVIRRLERRMCPRSVLAACIVIQGLVCLLPVTIRAEWALWVTFAVASLASSIIWPVVESYLTAGWHGARMRSAIGAFNLTWMPAVALPLLLMPPILEHHGQWAIGAQAVLSIFALVPLRWFARRPRHHAPEDAAGHETDEYVHLLRSARVLLPLSYLLNAALTPVLPYRFEALGAPITWETPITATWMLVRVVAVTIMWRVGFWHGRWGTLLTAALAMAGGFALIVLAPALWLMTAGFAVFGIGLGAAYYAALYYAMTVGRAEVDAGGTHEALIGAGYAVGPMAALAGTAIGDLPAVPLDRPGAIVAILWTLVGAGAIAAVAPYRRARRQRRP